MADSTSNGVLGTFSSPGEVISYIAANDIKMVDLRFTDLLGTTQHFTIPAALLDETMFRNGTGFDGSAFVGSRQSTSPTCS